VVDLAPVVVTGTRTARVITEAPVATELILQSDFDDYHVTTFKDALKLIPSARFESDCQNCGLNQIQLLGLSTDYTSILFDGAPLYSGLAKVYGADLFPAIFVDRIEVVKGGSSVLYGPEAIAGVVNLLTTEPAVTGYEARTSLESLKGEATQWESSFMADYVQSERAYSISAYGFYQDREALDLTTDGFSELPEFENKVVGLQSWLHPVENGTFKLTYQYLDQAHRGGDQLDLPEEQARVAESLAHEIHMAHADWHHLFTDNFDYNLRTSYLYIERTSFYGARATSEQRAYEEAGYSGAVTDAFIDSHQAEIDAMARRTWGLTENAVYYLDSQFNHYWGKHTVSYGVQYLYEDLKDGSLYDDEVPETEDDFSNRSAFLQDQWMLTPTFELVPGVRVDDHDNVEDLVVSPRVAARWSASDEVTVRASWSTGFNAPGAFNEDKHIGVNNGGAIYLVNEPGLQEESSQTWSMGAEYQPNALDRQLILHSQVHYTQLKDTFEIDDTGETSGDPSLWLRVNGPDSTVFVWENNVNWQLHERVRLDVGFSYIRSRYDEEIARVTGLTTDEYLKQPEWTASVGLSYENHDLVDAHAMLTYTGEMLAVGEDADIWRETPDFYVLDLGISKDFHLLPDDGEVRVGIGVDNLFDERQKDLQDNGEDRDPTYLYGPVQPRTWYVKLTAAW